jgi:hypothetical protein
MHVIFSGPTQSSKPKPIPYLEMSVGPGPGPPSNPAYLQTGADLAICVDWKWLNSQMYVILGTENNRAGIGSPWGYGRNAPNADIKLAGTVAHYDAHALQFSINKLTLQNFSDITSAVWWQKECQQQPPKILHNLSKSKLFANNITNVSHTKGTSRTPSTSRHIIIRTFDNGLTPYF